MSKAIAGYRFDGAADRSVHDGDCWFGLLNVCTCGLLHKASHEGCGEDWFGKEDALQTKVYYRLLDLIPVIESEPCQTNLQTDGDATRTWM